MLLQSFLSIQEYIIFSAESATKVNASVGSNSYIKGFILIKEHLILYLKKGIKYLHVSSNFVSLALTNYVHIY